MIQQPQPPKTSAPEQGTDTVERLLKQAEIFRLTRSLKAKLAQASLKANKSPSKTPVTDQRRRAKTLDGASSAPRAVDWSNDTPISQRSGLSRKSSATSIRSSSSLSSQLSASSLASPRARIPRISSVNSIPEAANEQHLSGTSESYVSPTRDVNRTAHQFISNDSPSSNYVSAAAAAAAAAAAPAHSSPSSSPMYSSSPNTSKSLFQNHLTSQYSPRQPIQARRRSNPASFNSESLNIPSLKVSAGEGNSRTIPGSNSMDEEPSLPAEPQTPPSRKRVLPKTPEQASTADGANLLLHFAHSPGRGTPRTPDFNVNDYLHFQTPSPARGQLTPSQMRFGSLNSALFSSSGSTPSLRPDDNSGF